MKKSFLALSLALATSIASADSFPPIDVSVSQQSGDNGFTYPNVTHLESEAIVNDVVFFYTPEMITYFDNDMEKLVGWIESSVELNNDAFKRQNIPIRRNITGIVRFPSSNDFNPEGARKERISDIRSFYNSSSFNFNYFYDVSYVVAITPHLSEFEDAIGAAEVGGKFSWVSPYRPESPERTLAHELGHNDGFTHDSEEYDEIEDKRGRFQPYAVGDSCGTFSSIMKSGSGDRSERFFSSPIVTNAQGTECGVENVSDAARAYMEAYEGDLREQTGTFANNKPTREATGTATLSILSSSVAEGQPIVAEIVWSGAELGDSVRVISRQGEADLNDFSSTLRNLYFDGESTTTRFEIPTIDDDKFELDESVLIEMIHPHGVRMTGEETQTVSITSDEAGNAGLIDFTFSSLSIDEGETASLTLQRQGGSDGTFTVNVRTQAGTAEDNDFTQVDRDITFLEGQTSKIVSISTRNDTAQEAAERFTVTLTGNSMLIGDNAEVDVTIAASDSPSSGGNGSGGNGGSNAGSSDGGGGSMGIFSGLLLALVAIRRIRFAK